MIRSAFFRHPDYRQGVRLLAAFALCGGLTACSPLSEKYAERLNPLHVVTYATSDNQVLKKRAYFGDGHSNVLVLTDDAGDGLLPGGDRDGLVDQVSLEIYNRGLLFDFVIEDGVLYSNRLTPRRVKPLKGVSSDVARILTDRFVRQYNFMKTASARTQYELSLTALDASAKTATVEVDSVSGGLHVGNLQKINHVYLMLAAVGKLDSATDSDFAVIQIGNQDVLLKAGQKANISIDQAEAANSKLSKSEAIHFVFVISDTAAPSREDCELEDIFHTFLVDRPGYEHISYYRLAREFDHPWAENPREISGTKTVAETFEDESAPKRGFFSGLTGNINDGVKDFLHFLYGEKEKDIPILSFDLLSK